MTIMEDYFCKVSSTIVLLETSDIFPEKQFFEIFKHLNAVIAVPKYEGQDKPFECLNYDNHFENIEKALVSFAKLIDGVNQYQQRNTNSSPVLMRGIVLDALLLTSEYECKLCPWTSEKSILACESIRNVLLSIANVRSLVELFIGNTHTEKTDLCTKGQRQGGLLFEHGLFVPLFQLLSQKLNKTEWKKFPAAKFSYRWILENLCAPYVGEHLGYLLPPALFIIDDWDQYHKIFGLDCIDMIISNTTLSELRWYGRAEVIYEATKNLMYTREPDLVRKIYPVIARIANIIESDPGNCNTSRVNTRYDSILQQLLKDMAYEHRIVLRKAFVYSLCHVIPLIGIELVRWSKELVRIFKDYLATIDGASFEDQFHLLKTMQAFVRSCWPQIHFHLEVLLKTVIQFLYDLHRSSASSDRTCRLLTEESIQVITLLCAAAPERTKQLCHGIETTPLNKDCIFRLKSVIFPNDAR